MGRKRRLLGIVEGVCWGDEEAGAVQYGDMSCLRGKDMMAIFN